MAQDEIHVNDIGTVFEVTLKDGSSVVDVSAATTKQIIFQKPDGTNLTKTAAFTTDGTDGKIQYTTVSGDLDVTGLWKIQGSITLSGGSWKTDVSSFKVHENL